MATRSFSACLNPVPCRSRATACPPATGTDTREEELAQPVSQIDWQQEGSKSLEPGVHTLHVYSGIGQRTAEIACRISAGADGATGEYSSTGVLGLLVFCIDHSIDSVTPSLLLRTPCIP